MYEVGQKESKHSLPLLSDYKEFYELLFCLVFGKGHIQQCGSYSGLCAQVSLLVVLGMKPSVSMGLNPVPAQFFGLYTNTSLSVRTCQITSLKIIQLLPSLILFSQQY